MRVAKDQVDTRMQIPGAVIRQRKDFGEMHGYGKVSGEYFTLAKGVDTAPLFQGLEGDLCQCPHWGFVLQGRAHHHRRGRESGDGRRPTTCSTGRRVTTCSVDADAEIIMFSPQHEHTKVINHMLNRVNGYA